MSDLENQLRREVLQKQKTLETLERILIGDTTGMLSQEKIKKEIEENNAVISKIQETLEGYVKVKPDVPLDKQIKRAVSRYTQKIQENKEYANEYREATATLQKRIKKYESQRIPLNTLVVLKKKVHKINELLQQTREDFNKTKTDNFQTVELMKKNHKKSVRTFENKLSEINENHKIELKSAKKQLRQARRSQQDIKDILEERKNAFTKKIVKFNNKFDQTFNSFNEKIILIQGKIQQFSKSEEEKKQKSDKLTSERVKEIDISEQKSKIQTVYKKEWKKSEEIMEKKTKEEIKRIKQEIEIEGGDDDENEQLSEEDKKKRYLQALNHLKAHMKQYPYKQEIIPKYPGQVV